MSGCQPNLTGPSSGSQVTYAPPLLLLPLRGEKLCSPRTISVPTAAILVRAISEWRRLNQAPWEGPTAIPVAQSQSTAIHRDPHTLGTSTAQQIDTYSGFSRSVVTFYSLG